MTYLTEEALIQAIKNMQSAELLEGAKMRPTQFVMYRGENESLEAFEYRCIVARRLAEEA